MVCPPSQAWTGGRNNARSARATPKCQCIGTARNADQGPLLKKYGDHRPTSKGPGNLGRVAQQQIERTSNGTVIIAPAMQRLEIGLSGGTQADDLRVDDGEPSIRLA